jgi:hypothetical protein
MSHFARVLNNKVASVIRADQDFIDSLPDKELWIQTSYNTRRNVHYTATMTLTEVTVLIDPTMITSTATTVTQQLIEIRVPDDRPPLRGNFAQIGYIYDPDNDVFIEPKPYSTWKINTSTCTWEAPVNPVYGGGIICYWSDRDVRWIEPFNTTTDYAIWIMDYAISQSTTTAITTATTIQDRSLIALALSTQTEAQNGLNDIKQLITSKAVFANYFNNLMANVTSTDFYALLKSTDSLGKF